MNRPGASSEAFPTMGSQFGIHSALGLESSPEVMSMTIVVTEATSPDTTAVNSPQGVPPPRPSLPVIASKEAPIRVRTGEKFPLIFNRNNGRRIARLFTRRKATPITEVNFEYAEAQGPNSQSLITCSHGSSYGLGPDSHSIKEFSRLHLEDVAIHEPGHYHLHLIVKATWIEDGWEVTEALTRLISCKIEVSG
ncbi:hypothetical protein AAE478_009460 [Parahypoxylon ruwenzoriense]